MKNCLSKIVKDFARSRVMRYSILFLFFIFSSEKAQSQAHITMSMMNCQAVGNNQLQFDVVVVNDGTLPIKFSSAIIRFNYGNALVMTLGTISWGNVTSNIAPNWAATGFYTITASTRLCNFSSGTGFWTTAAAAPDLPINVPVILGRFYFQTSTSFTANVASQLYWATTASVDGWVNGAAAATTINSGKIAPCNILLNPIGILPCPTSITANVTNPTCFNTSGSVQISMLPANAIPVGNYTLNSGSSTAFNSNPFTINTLSPGSYTVSVLATGACAPVSTTFTIANAPILSTSTTNQTACVSYTWPVNGVTYANSGLYSYYNNCNLDTLNLNIIPGHLELATSGNVSSIIGSSILNNSLSNNTTTLFANGCNYSAMLTDNIAGIGMGATSLTTQVDAMLPLINMQVYSPRHFTVNATNNEQGSITFYAAQDDFDDYNAANGNFLDMTASTLKLHQITNSGTTITQIPTTCVWNAIFNRYEITCTPNLVNGDYYFYTDLPCQQIILPSTVSNITSTTAFVTWPIATGVISYNIRYRIVGTLTWSIVNSNTNNVNFAGLAAGTNYEFQIRANCGASIYGAWGAINNFTTLPNVCVSPTSPIVANITTNSAYISWPVVVGAAYYLVRYRPITNPASAWTTTSIVTNPWKQLNSLSLGTAYQVQVAEWCSAGTILSNFSSITSFTTLGITSCAAPTGLSATNTSTTAMLNWNAIIGASSYTIRYRSTPLGAWNVTNSPVNSKLVSNLLPVTNYEFQVRSYCSNIANYSAWSALFPFTTPLKPAHSTGGDAFSAVGGNDKSKTKVYPNPVSTQLIIHYVAMEAGELCLQLVDVTGRVVYKYSLKGIEGMNPLEIDMSDFAQGVYHLQITENGKLSYQEKVMKQ